MVDKEIHSILSNNNWILVNLSQWCKPIKSKWIFKKKVKPDGTIEKYKAWLVAKGYTEKKDFNFFNTYVLVVRISTIRLLMVVVAIKNLTIHHMDVETVFLNGQLEEDIYIKKLEWYIILGKKKKVCKLIRTLNRLSKHSSNDMTISDKLLLAMNLNPMTKTCVSIQRPMEIHV